MVVITQILIVRYQDYF